MVSGIANVTIDPSFAAVMDRGIPSARELRWTLEARVRLSHRGSPSRCQERPIAARSCNEKVAIIF
jgi:hypothetical protein